MNKKLFLSGMLACVLAFGLALTGCATDKATTKSTNFENKPLDVIGSPKYTILGSDLCKKVGSEHSDSVLLEWALFQPKTTICISIL
ncbi:MAG: hypothetical protein LBO67_03970 [Spirochaetaceae bacterium]|jgi:hypothetical protein|nr:hypothetical protein [Spirochaetaceae bacterium]